MKLKHLLYDYIVTIGFSENAAKYVNMLVLLIILLIIVFTVDFLIRKIIRSFFAKFANETKTNFDNLLLKNKVPRNMAHIIPLIIALQLSPIVFADFANFANSLACSQHIKHA